MDSIREPLLFCCMIIVVGGIFTMVAFITTLVIKGALKKQSPSAPAIQAQSPPLSSTSFDSAAPALMHRPLPRPQPLSS